MRKFSLCVSLFIVVSLALLAFTQTPAFAEANTLMVVSDPAHGDSLKPWISALIADGIEVELLTPEAFEKVKDAQYACILGVANSDDKAFPYLEKALSAAEIKEYAAIPNRNMFIRRDVWKPGQRILVFVASSPEALNEVRKNTRTAWWSYLSSWFEIENESMHGY